MLEIPAFYKNGKFFIEAYYICLFLIRVNFIRMLRLDFVENLRRSKESFEAQIQIIFKFCSCAYIENCAVCWLRYIYVKIFLIIAIDTYLISKTYLLSVLSNRNKTPLTFFAHVYPRKQRFLLRMYQEYSRLIFGKNIGILSFNKDRYFGQNRPPSWGGDSTRKKKGRNSVRKKK